MDEIVLRKAKPEDAPGISRVHEASIRGLCAGFYTAQQIDSWAQPRELAHYLSAIKSTEFYVGMSRGEVVGFGQLDADKAKILAIYVSPTHANRGLGKKLLSRLVQAARDAGLVEVRLNASKNSIPFYRASGFRELNSAIHQLHNGVELECVEMAKAI